MFTRKLIIAALLVLTTTLTAHASVVFSLNPSNGSVSDLPGATVGWGFTLTNNTVDWLILTGSTFNMNETWGTYTDYVPGLGTLAVIAPSGSLTQDFVLNSTGIGHFAIDANAPVPATTFGPIVLSYNTYDGNPDTVGNLVILGNEVSANASVSTPEPSTYALLCISLGVVGYARRKMVKS
jgi:hypothetical protein